ncbi:collagen alpha-1(IX) chain-like [Hoplias malabaricus]|uniref:collagen alpha-1(IX) chain-like n=1 Tax=Hoplias malabaricus TaxID=27720 RepID=UPI0034621695
MRSAVGCGKRLKKDRMLRRGLLFYLLCNSIPLCFSTGLTVPVSVQSPQSRCPQTKVGESYLPGFYTMAQFQIVELARRGSVKEVPGWTPEHTAYKIGPHFNFRINTRSAYPTGLPEEFAFEAVFRMHGDTLNRIWNIWQMQDLNGNEQLAVSLNGQALSVEFSYITAENGVATALFPHLPFLFNSRWHKMLLVVKRSTVSLIVDCVLVGTQQLSARGRVSLDGYTYMAKLKDNTAVSVPFELQLMLIHCDVTVLQRDTCGNLPASSSVKVL